jgi:hypothetical protein
VVDANKDGVPEVIGIAPPDGYLLFLRPLTKYIALPLVQR